ncbi:hypothetical protein Q9966_016794 [Columba livia]|nr:hypothetical protein Q9966_016794 [Columba livia]
MGDNLGEAEVTAWGGTWVTTWGGRGDSPGVVGTWVTQPGGWQR